MGKLKLGIAGYGGFGQGLTKRFAKFDDVEIISIFNREDEYFKKAKEDGHTIFADYSEFLNSGLEAVAICTVNSAHAQQCIKAAEAGKHVFCEKPLTLSLETYGEILNACAKAGVITHLDMSMRFSPELIALKKLVRDGKLGRPLQFWVHRGRGYGFWSAGRRHPAVQYPTASGGWNLHHNVHGMDAILQLAGKKVVSVYGKNLKSADDAPADELNQGILNFEDDCIGQICDSVSIRRFENYGMIGTKGTAWIENNDKKEDPIVSVRYENGEKEEIKAEPSTEDETCLAFIKACLGEDSERIPFEEGYHCLEVLLAMNKSSETGEVVRIRENKE